jgi:hypothetical protein
MSLFSGKGSQERCGVIIDVGSGSVGMAVVLPSLEDDSYEILWSHREYMLIHDDAERAQKQIATTIVNAFLELGVGLKAARERGAAVGEVQIALCAPWAITVSKHINYEDEHPFATTKEFMRNLVETAKKQTLETAYQGTLLKDLGLTLLEEATVDVELNGYHVRLMKPQEVRTVSLTHIRSFADEKLVDLINDSLDKVIPHTKRYFHSFMFLFSEVLRSLHPDTNEACLIDITNEATEVGILNDDVLRSATHTPSGLFSLARRIAAECGIPNEEAYSFMKNGNNYALAPHLEKKKETVERIFAEYEDELAKLMRDSRDALSIPNTVFLHTSAQTEECFLARIKNAMKKATNTDHAVHLVTTELLGEKRMDDSALALSVHFFLHREEEEEDSGL